MKKRIATSILTMLIGIITISTFGQNSTQEKEKKVAEFKSSYVSGIKRCIEIANEISQTKNDTTIERLKLEGKKKQAQAFNAFLGLQNPDLNFSYDKIKAMKPFNPTFFGFGGVFSDDNNLKLPAKEYKEKVKSQLEKINSAKTAIDNF